MAASTIFLSKLIGVYCILLSIAMALNKNATLQMVTALLHDAPVLYVLGSTIAVAGLAIVIAHNRWTGAVAGIVTIVGWSTLLKGLLFLYVPPNSAGGIAVWGMPYQRLYYIDVLVALVLGIYLAYHGFTARRGSL